MGENYVTQIAGANAMPAPTWHFLKMNDTVIELPEGLAVAPAVSTAVSEDALAPEGSFEFSLAMLQTWWDASHLAPSAQEQAELDAVLAAESDATYGGTAQSRYQVRADKLEASRSLEASFATGVGEQAAAFLHESGEAVTISSGEGETVNARVTVVALDQSISTAAIDVIAAIGSTVNLDIVVDSAGAPAGAVGVAGTTLRVLAGFGAQVNVRRTQTLDGGFQDIDDMGFLTADDARVKVSQTVLGAGRTFTGLACDLRGRSSRIDIDLHYLGHGMQDHDFNYVVNHRGESTQSDIHANGVLAGSSQKTLRGTIDLIRGCKGAQGNESETVLLVDEGVRNRTVPVILCNEDDVAGNHGATIGHVSAEQLHFLKARGLTQQQVEALFLEASFDRAFNEAPSEQSAAGVERLARQVLGHSVALRDLEEEAEEAARGEEQGGAHGGAPAATTEEA